MKFHKTPRSKRSTYTYEVYDSDGTRLPSIVIRPGEEGVTEVDIKALHALDDSEVYYNLKASKPGTDTELKNKREEWREQYIEEFIKQYGYSPHPKDVEDAVNERFPKNWTESLEKLQESSDDADKSALSLLFFCPHFSSPVERMREIIGKLPPKEQSVYWLVLVGGEKKKDVAEELGISDVRVSQIAKKIQKLLADDEVLKSFFK
ncbi:MAG: sigma-70 family RNA polymerase sigma factor [Clostridia bacterium]|nr:sigma-70 family RNA polymerase sigma factor [Clostridia bacterium]